MFRLGRLVAATSRYVVTSIIISKRQCLSLTPSLLSSSSSSSLSYIFYRRTNVRYMGGHGHGHGGD